MCDVFMYNSCWGSPPVNNNENAYGNLVYLKEISIAFETLMPTIQKQDDTILIKRWWVPLKEISDFWNLHTCCPLINRTTFIILFNVLPTVQHCYFSCNIFMYNISFYIWCRCWSACSIRVAWSVALGIGGWVCVPVSVFCTVSCSYSKENPRGTWEAAYTK